ncbi:cell division cycle protein-like protein 23 [Tothia fuscella]|uniref:Cell division cycle protein-like protein 23 n=1 Tax=Tothia fuscella TaxID=1048955 RepID=A0A9P4TVF2_9PEZI|nr:cell division cycle protein-like protein 23 [Tothia fuscella]
MASGLSDNQIAELQYHLQNSVQGCTDRCLYQSAKWAAELLNSIPLHDEANGSDTDPDSPMSDGTHPKHNLTRTPVDPFEARRERKEHHKFLLAKTYFDCREFDRCAGVFLPHTLPRIPSTTHASPSAKSKDKGKAKAKAPSASQSSPPLSLEDVSQKALFLALYAKYLSGEERKDEESEMILGPADGGVTMNKELNGISAVLDQWFQERHAKQLDGGGWLEYLYGIILAKGKNEELAKHWLLRSVNIYPFNWGAWQELGHLINTAEELDPITELLPRNIMTFIFHIHTSQELALCTEQIHASLTQVQSFFPHSMFLQSQRALLYYHSKDFDESASIFSTILQTDPYRLDGLDSYSNCLYVMESRPKLAFLAQLASQIDKFRPETCCIIGNYYSILSEHEKAVMYFRRALTLDRNFLSAWTLMGHEYVEMKNTHAALESYRRAVDANRKDYRAWYGMGQTYEMLEMNSYALFYFQRAASLRPFDAKIWQAVGSSFAQVGKLNNAIRAYKRALVAGSYYEGTGTATSSFGSEKESHGLGGGVLDPECLYQIANLYERMDDRGECAAYMELCLAQEEPANGNDDLDEGLTAGLYGANGSSANNPAQGSGVTATTSRARMWLAKFEFGRGNMGRANELANELCQDGWEVEEAKALQRDIRAREDVDR